MPRSDATRRAQNKYDAANRMMLGARVKKTDGKLFRAICAAAGKTPNAVLVDYVRACLARGCIAAITPADASTAAVPAPKREQPPKKSTGERDKRRTAVEQKP